MEELASFLSKYPTREYPKGTIILHQGTKPSCMYVIKSGFVKNYEISADGVQKPIMFDQANEMFPAGWLFDHFVKAQYFYEAFTDVVAYTVPKEDLRHFLQAHPLVQYQLFSGFIKRMLDLQIRFVSLQQNKATDKILLTLSFLALRFADRTQLGQVRVYLPLTQQDMANYMGLTRETTATELMRLQKKRILHYDHQKYYINTKKLQAEIDKR